MEDLDHTPSIGGLDETAKRLERLFEGIRAELGATEHPARWEGLAGSFTEAHAGLESRASDLARALVPGAEDPATDGVRLRFVLRQLEISLGLIARLVSHVCALRQEVKQLRNELALSASA